ncbi:MAG: hypothetical protein WAO52_06905 [Prolixibacteraceae bacterium]
MKNIFYLCLILLLISSCSADHFLPASVKISKTGRNVPVRHVVWFESIPDENNMLECGLPASGMITGHCNLLGDIVADQSPFTIWHWHFDPDSSEPKIVESIEGTITGQNGDSYFYTGIITTRLSDMSFTGKMFINGGVRSLDCLEGECFMSGSSASGVSKWTAEGLVTKTNKPDKIIPEFQPEPATK